MLSVLIPVYNYNITELVNTLHRQCMESNIIFEILCFDDASKDTFKTQNQAVGVLSNVIYKELPQNLGRSKIRNELAKAARYDHLLFLDCDSKVVSENYIKNYVENLRPDSLLYGGRVYQPEPPTAEFYFHWFYGIHREQMKVEKRKLNPYHSFMTNNFLIPKAVFLQILFDESLTLYGHEDTLFGLQLQLAQIPIAHIDNPLQHDGLETTAVFLKKTQEGVENLWRLSQRNSLIDTTLLRAFKWVKKSGLSQLVWFVYVFVKPFLIRNFHSTRVYLKLFDLYKLGLLIETDKKQKH